MPSTGDMYQKHNLEQRGRGFALFEKERGEFFSRKIGQGKKVIDLGSRDGALTKYIVLGNEVWAADVDAQALSFLKESLPGAATVVLDLNAEKWDLPQNYFDAVILAETLEHLFYPEKVLPKIVSLLKDGGMLVGSVPNSFSLKNRLRLFSGRKKYSSLGDPTHVNHFSHGELGSLLSKNFKQVKIYPLIQPRYRVLARISPNFFSFSLLFWAQK